MTTATRSEKLDLAKLRPDAFKADVEPELVMLEPAYYLVLNGAGNPNKPGSTFLQSVGVLYSVAYQVKMRYKAMGMDYKMPPFEALWWAYGTFGDQPRDLEQPGPTWRWRAMLMVPDYVEREQLEAVKAKRLAQKGTGAVDCVDLQLVDEGLSVQALHVGPYPELPKTIANMRGLMEQSGLRACGPHHEIYLNDPGSTPPGKLRTILRQPVSRVEDDCPGAVEEW